MAEIGEGSVIGNYRVIRLLGQGGMGTVYEVEHLELGTHYALKTFTFDQDNDANHALKKKFLEEGKLLARLKHPNLTHVFDLGFEDETQMPYFVMDLVVYADGETYTVEDIDLKDIEEDMVYGWFKQLASALDYIHGEGIVHRDIKPSNLLVDKDLNVVLTDFGISRIFGQRIKGEVEATKTMVSKTGRGKLVLGTEHYIAPEVAAGEDATPKADAYALGVMLLRWLTGFYYGDNPGAIALLSRKKYQWVGVISRLLAPSDRRPEKYAELVNLVKPAPKPAPLPKPQGGKKHGRAKENVIIAAASLLVVGVLCAAGYGAWRYMEGRNAERDRQVAALAQQIREKEAADRKARAEEEAARKAKEAEEKRIAEEKRMAREAKIAEQRRIEESRTKIEKQDASQLTVRETPKVETPEPEPEKPKEEFIVVKEEVTEEVEKDYGPIPGKKYVWLKGNNAANPLPIEFCLTNGEKLDLIPQKAGVFYMSNPAAPAYEWTQHRASGRSRHKVTITRPFWMTKFCLTINEWREYAPNDLQEYKPIEAAVGKDKPIYKKFNRKQIDAFCEFLTAKYRSQIPAGYVFRLPSEAEWEYALALDETKSEYELPGKKSWEASVKFNGEFAKKAFAEYNKKVKLEKFGNWDEWGGLTQDGEFRREIFIGGNALPHASGICDMSFQSVMLDTVERDPNRQIIPQRIFTYADEEKDPLHWFGDSPRYDESNMFSLSRSWLFNREAWGVDGRIYTHIVLGPDLIKEKAWLTTSVAIISPKVDKLPQRKYDWNPEKVPHKISKPKEIKFKMHCGSEIVFCTVPKGHFNMSNIEGQPKSHHQVEITRPFWISKYCISVDQWREYGPYDCEGDARIVERLFPRNKIYQQFRQTQYRKFCEFLTERYGSQLPLGYVFRLPTEAEFEWALVANEKGTVQNLIGIGMSPESQDFRNEFTSFAKKNKSIFSKFDWGDIGRINNLFVGGRTKGNAIGLCDANLSWLTLAFLDSYDIPDVAHDWKLSPQKYIQYGDKDIDPIHFAGWRATRVLHRAHWTSRGLVWPSWGTGFAHIVVGPDIEKPLVEKELAPYPETDFAGVYVGDQFTIAKQSSVDRPEWNTAECHKSLLSRGSILKLAASDAACISGFHTDKEINPWVQLEAKSIIPLAGIVIDKFHNIGQAEHLRVWISEDGKKWREVASENDILHRYRFDFHSKNLKAKYIRIGREPGVRNDWFGLDKVIIYAERK